MSEHDQLLADLKSGSTDQKRHALDAFTAIGKRIVPALFPVILDADEQFIEWTLDGYDYERGEGQKNNFRQIEDAIADDYWYVTALTSLLISFHDASLDHVVNLLTHERPIIRTWAAFVLGEIGDRRAVAPLLARLHVASQSELARACEALGKLRAVEAVERLIELLEHEDNAVDSYAARALGRIGDRRALMPLIEQFKQHKTSVYAVSAALFQFQEHAVGPLIDVLFDDGARQVHDLALMNLGMLQDSRAIEPIMRYLDNAQDAASKCHAMTALGQLQAEQAVQRIAELFCAAVDSDMRGSAAMALGNIGNEDAFRILLDELRHGTPENQHAAALAFGEMKTIDDIEPLLTEFRNASPRIRSAIAVALGNLQDIRAIPALTDALNDPDKATRQYAQLSLQKINGVEDT
jgi:HEAT repeat protein